MADDDLAVRVEEALKGSKNPEASRFALAILFPKLEKILKTYIPRRLRQDTGERKRAYRISEREFASTYFGLTPRHASWGRKTLQAIFDMEPNVAMSVIEERMTAYAEKDQIALRREILNALPGAFNELRPFTGEWLRVLSDYLPRYVDTKLPPIGFYNVDAAQRLRHTAFQALRNETTDHRAEAFVYAASSAFDISLICSLFRTVAGDLNEDGAKNRDRDFFGTEITEQIRGILLERVVSIAYSGSLWSQASPATLLWFWWGCDQGDQVRQFTSEAMDTVDGLRGLLDAPVHRVYSTSGDYDVVDPSQWQRIVDVDKLKLRAQTFADQTKNENDHWLVERFLSALDRGSRDPF